MPDPPVDTARLDEIRQMCDAPSDAYSAGEWCEAANVLLGLFASVPARSPDEDADSVECAYPPCRNRLRYSEFGAQFCSKEHRSLAFAPARSPDALTALRDEIAMADQSAEKLSALRANWRRIVEEQDSDGGPLIENILYWLIEDVTPSAEARALARSAGNGDERA